MPTRRQVLQQGGVIGVGVLTGLAGCLGNDDSGVTFDEWLIDPFYLPERRDRYEVTVMSPHRLDEYSDEFPRDEWNSFEEGMLGDYEFTRLFADEVERIIIGGNGYRWSGFDVVTGDFDADSLIDDIERSDYRSQGDYDGFELFEHDEQWWSIGVSDETFVLAGSGEDQASVQFVEDIIDASEGERDRYTEIDEDFETLVSATDAHDLYFASSFEAVDETNIEQGEFRNSVARANSYELGEDQSTLRMTFVFLSERDVTERDIEDWTRDGNEFDSLRDIEISVDDEIVHIDSEFRTRDLFDL